LISRADGKLKLVAHSVECVAHGSNVLGLESVSTGSRSWHLGATDVRSGAVPCPPRSACALAWWVYNEIAISKGVWVLVAALAQ
jgi:hypothetical protein